MRISAVVLTLVLLISGCGKKKPQTEYTPTTNPACTNGICPNPNLPPAFTQGQTVPSGGAPNSTTIPNIPAVPHTPVTPGATNIPPLPANNSEIPSHITVPPPDKKE